MKFKKIWEFFDKKKLHTAIKITVFFLVLIIIVNIIGVTYSKYEGSADMYAEAKIAYFITKTGTYEKTISLDGLTPQEDAFLYTINVYNYNGTNKSNVDMKYTIKFKTTTNLPLTYDVICNETYSENSHSIISSSSIEQDGDMYYNVLNVDTEYQFSYTENQMNQYTIVVHFPESYKNADEYAGAIDLITVIIDAEQVV